MATPSAAKSWERRIPGGCGSPRCRGAREPVVDGLAQAVLRHRHDGDRHGAHGVERAQMGKEIGRGLHQVAVLREVAHGGGLRRACDQGLAEGEQRLARRNAARGEPQARARRIVRDELAGRDRRRVAAGVGRGG